MAGEFVHVSREGKIYVEGELVGTVHRSDPELSAFGEWRAEVDLAPSSPGMGLRIAYGRTRKQAVAGATQDLGL